jgi:hypothetical protein
MQERSTLRFQKVEGADNSMAKEHLPPDILPNEARGDNRMTGDGLKSKDLNRQF